MPEHSISTTITLVDRKIFPPTQPFGHAVEGVPRAGPSHAVYVNACLINCWLFIHFLVRLAFRPSGGAPKGPQIATTIASSSTTPAPAPRHQRLTTVGGWCDPIIQPFLIQAFLFSGVSVTQKRMDGKIWYFGPKTSSRFES